MKVGDLVAVEYIGPGIITQIKWDSEYSQHHYRIRYVCGSWSWEEEQWVELVSESR